MLQIKISKKEARELFLHAKRVIKGADFDLLLAPKSGILSRLLIVTAAYIGTAPERNRVRRRLRAVFREHKFYDYSCDCIVIVKKNGIGASYEKLLSLLQSAYATCEKL